jgi:hypothetical protein
MKSLEWIFHSPSTQVAGGATTEKSGGVSFGDDEVVTMKHGGGNVEILMRLLVAESVVAWDTVAGGMEKTANLGTATEHARKVAGM